MSAYACLIIKIICVFKTKTCVCILAMLRSAIAWASHIFPRKKLNLEPVIQELVQTRGGEIPNSEWLFRPGKGQIQHLKRPQTGYASPQASLWGKAPLLEACNY